MVRDGWVAWGMESHGRGGHLQASKIGSSVGILPEEPVQIVEDALAPALLLFHVILPLSLHLCCLQVQLHTIRIAHHLFAKPANAACLTQKKARAQDVLCMLDRACRGYHGEHLGEQGPATCL